jgi:hypothetical protein
MREENSMYRSVCEKMTMRKEVEGRRGGGREGGREGKKDLPQVLRRAHLVYRGASHPPSLPPSLPPSFPPSFLQART